MFNEKDTVSTNDGNDVNKDAYKSLEKEFEKTDEPSDKIEKLKNDIAELKETVENLKKTAGRIDESVGIFDENITKIGRQQGFLSKQQKKIERETRRNQAKVIESIGIFVALFTFVSVSTNIFLKFESIYNALFFLSIFAIVLTSFLIVFHFILNIYEELQIKKLFLILSCLVIPFSLVAIVIYYIGTISVDEKDKTEDKDKQIVHQTTDVNIGMDTIISTNTITISTNVYTSLKSNK